MLQDLPVSASSRRLRVQAETQRRLTLNSILIPGPLFGSLVRLCWGRAMMFLPGATRATKAMWSVVASQRITSHHNSLFSLLKVMSKGGGKVSHLPKSAEVKKAFPRSRILQESVPNKLKTPQIASTENAVLWTFLPKFSCSHPQTTAGRDESTESAWIFRRFQRCSNLPSFLPDPALPLYFIIRFTLCFLSHSLQLSVSSLIYSHFPFPL